MFTRRLSADIFEPGRPAGLWSSGSRPPTHSIRTAARTWLMNHPVDTEFLRPTWRSTIDAIFRYIFTIYKLPLPKAARAWDSLQYDNWRAPLFSVSSRNFAASPSLSLKFEFRRMSTGIVPDFSPTLHESLKTPVFRDMRSFSYFFNLTYIK